MPSLLQTALALALFTGADAFVPRPMHALRIRAATTSLGYTVTLIDPEGAKQSFDCPEDETILDAAEDILGLELPASCRSGSCTSCQVGICEAPPFLLCTPLRDRLLLSSIHLSAAPPRPWLRTIVSSHAH